MLHSFLPLLYLVTNWVKLIFDHPIPIHLLVEKLDPHRLQGADEGTLLLCRLSCGPQGQSASPGIHSIRNIDIDLLLLASRWRKSRRAIHFKPVLGVSENVDPVVGWESNGVRDLVIQVDKEPLGTSGLGRPSGMGSSRMNPGSYSAKISSMY